MQPPGWPPVGVKIGAAPAVSPASPHSRHSPPFSSAPSAITRPPGRRFAAAQRRSKWAVGQELTRAAYLKAVSQAENERLAARAEARRVRQAEAKERQDRLPLLYAMPATMAECRGGPGSSDVAEFIAEFGACPVLRCRYNLALWVKDNGSIKVEGGHVAGGTLRHNRRASAAKVDRLAEMVVQLADRLGTLCLWDILPEASMVDLGERRVSMPHEAIGRVLGQSKEIARQIVDGALESLDIAEARMRRRQKAARQEVAKALVQDAEALRKRLRGGRDQFVQIRPRPPR